MPKSFRAPVRPRQEPDGKRRSIPGPPGRWTAEPDGATDDARVFPQTPDS